jgi:hypothetical protein
VFGHPRLTYEVTHISAVGTLPTDDRALTREIRFRCIAANTIATENWETPRLMDVLCGDIAPAA